MQGVLENKTKEGTGPWKIRFMGARGHRKKDLGGQGALENKVRRAGDPRKQDLGGQGALENKI